MEIILSEIIKTSQTSILSQPNDETGLFNTASTNRRFQNWYNLNRYAVLLVIMMPAVGMIIALVLIMMAITTNRTQIVGAIIILFTQYIVFCVFIYRKTKVIQYAFRDVSILLVRSICLINKLC